MATDKIAEYRINSFVDFFKVLEGLRPDPGFYLYYRGHSDKNYKLEPTIYRKTRHMQKEHQMFKELLIEKPEEFVNEKSTLDKLVKMQHHGLPTRLLDLTKNSLVALYFACSNSKEDGEVIILSIPSGQTEYDDSNAALILSNLCKLTCHQKKNERILDLLKEEILHEEPTFKSTIKLGDINKIICVTAKKKNERIKIQDGLFLLYGINESGDGYPLIEKQSWKILAKIIIDKKKKKKIKKQLEKINISESSLFPSLDSSAKLVKERYAIQN